MLHAIMTMTTDQVFTIAAVMVVIALILSAGAALFDFQEHGDTLGVAALLALIVEISFIVRMYPSPPDGVGTLSAFPVVDVIALIIMGITFKAKPRLWKAVVAFAFIAQLSAHGGYWLGRYLGNDNFPVYTLTINLLAGLQKVALGIAGAHGVAVGLSAWLSRHRPAGVRALFRGPHQ